MYAFAPLGAGISHFDVTDFIDVVAVFRRVADDEIELPLTLQHGSRDSPAHGCLHDRIHVARIEAIARGLLPIHFDVQVWLAEDRENAEIGNAADLAHLVANLIGQLRQFFQVGADDLDRVDAFDARNRFFDVVLNVLGEIENDARQFVLKFLLNLRGQLILGQVLGPFVKRFERGE